MRKQRVLAVSSGGGHWVQLLRVRSAFDGCDVAFVSVSRQYEPQVRPSRFYAVRDATRWDKFGLLVQAFQLATILIRERPDVVISTGAAPGYFAIRLAKLLSKRTVWIDSIANVEKLSMTGELVGRYADLWLTQWLHLARPQGPYFMGAVL
jgi:UDP-N-acetylglucosamine:LPS N-acetylglucosamine transferase